MEIRRQKIAPIPTQWQSDLFVLYTHPFIYTSLSSSSSFTNHIRSMDKMFLLDPCAKKQRSQNRRQMMGSHTLKLPHCLESHRLYSHQYHKTD